MPMGVKTCPQHFQFVITSILSAYHVNCCIIYLDDIVIFGRDWQSCWARTLDVIKAITDSGLCLSAAKAKFLTDDIILLGHRIYNGQSFPNPKRLHKLSEFAVPVSFKSLQSLFGLLNYFREYVPNFATITQSVTQLLGQRTTCEWTSYHSELVHTLHEYLKTA